MNRPPSDDVQRILEEYAIGSLRSTRLLYDEWNIAYQITTTQGKYVLKMRKLSSESQFKREISLCNALGDKVPHPVIVRTKKGALFSRWRRKIFYLMSFIEGATAPDGLKLRPKTLRDVGRSIALLHASPVRVARKDTRKEFLTIIAKAPRSSQEHIIATSMLSFLESEGFYRQKFPSGVIHGDPHMENILFKGGKVAALIDFEDVHIEPCIYDISFVALDTCFTNGSLVEQRLAAIIAGYEQVRKLSDLEKRYLRHAILHAGLYHLCCLIVKHGAPYPRTFKTSWAKRYIPLYEEMKGVGCR